jgi:hypothetical protein
MIDARRISSAPENPQFDLVPLLHRRFVPDNRELLPRRAARSNVILI